MYVSAKWTSKEREDFEYIFIMYPLKFFKFPYAHTYTTIHM